MEDNWNHHSISRLDQTTGSCNDFFKSNYVEFNGIYDGLEWLDQPESLFIYFHFFSMISRMTWPGVHSKFKNLEDNFSWFVDNFYSSKATFTTEYAVLNSVFYLFIGSIK